MPEATSSGRELLVEFTTSPFGTFLHPTLPNSLHGFQLEVQVNFRHCKPELNNIVINSTDQLISKVKTVLLIYSPKTNGLSLTKMFCFNSKQFKISEKLCNLKLIIQFFVKSVEVKLACKLSYSTDIIFCNIIPNNVALADSEFN